MTDSEAIKIITEKKKELGSKLVILGHHYQNDAVIEFADFIGDSLELSRKSAQLGDAQIIIFCGVYFMAETAYILSPDKEVYIPDKTAGCPLADMAMIKDVEKAWDKISAKPAMPVTYVNSSAEIKAFCGRHGGMVCTSGNAVKVFARALEETGRIFFMPDMNLGRNTACSLGINDSEIAQWDTEEGLDEKAAADARIILWKGWCPIHYPGFSKEEILKFREDNPSARVIIHPESDPSAVEASDRSASTAGIIDYADNQPDGSVIAVGTESNMVKRLASQNDRIKILPLKEAYCEDMAKITLVKLAMCFEELSGEYRVRVSDEVADDARKALKRMLEV